MDFKRMFGPRTPDEKGNQQAEIDMAKGEVPIPYMVTACQRENVDGYGQGQANQNGTWGSDGRGGFRHNDVK